jgi:hypothetical protein
LRRPSDTFGHAYYTNHHLQTITFVIFFTGKKGLPRYSLAMALTANITTSRPRWPAWLGATALLLASFLAVAALSLQNSPGAEVMAVMFPPWWNSRQALLAAASANAAIVRMTALPAMLVVRPDAHEGLARLRRAGAWLVIDPQAIAACFNNVHKDS